jgi:hypothetical protein
MKTRQTDGASSKGAAMFIATAHSHRASAVGARNGFNRFRFSGETFEEA